MTTPTVTSILKTPAKAAAAADQLSPGTLKSQARAEEITRQQIKAALKINGEMFPTEGLKNVGSVLQALAQNFHAQVLFVKEVK